jgi:hypothetical protein
VFRESGVRPSGFLLLRQHALFHYRRLIEDFGAPGGLCSSITELRHITAVKKPWRRSNRYEALGQMLRVNQRLDKLSAMHGDFTARGMLLRGYASKQNISLFLKPSAVGLGGEGEEDEEDGPVEGDDVLAHVILAQARGMWVYFSTGILFLFREVRNYPRDIETLATFIGEPELHNMALECIATQMHTSTKDLPCITSKISVFSSAVATFYAPSDPSGKNGMR